MPEIAIRQSAPTPLAEAIPLPPKVPELPEEVFVRFPSLRKWQKDENAWWARSYTALQDVNRTTSTALTKNTTDTRNLRVTFNNFTAEITEELEAIADETGAIAKRIVTVSAMAGVSQNIKVQSTAPVSPVLNDYWVDTSIPTLPITYQWNGASWAEVTTPISAAAVAEERTARVTGDGFLEGKYTLTVVAGNVITGFNITSASGPGTSVSNVSWTAGQFQIYNGTSGVPTFSVDTGTGQVSIAGAVVITHGQVTGLGDLATEDTADWQNQVTGTGKPEDNATLGAAWATNLTGRPVELTDGRVATALNSAGTVVTRVVPASLASPGSSGLYLGSDFLGFYNGAAWKSYMDNSGHFFLAGSSGNALAWDGTTLSIVGNITVSGGNAAKTDFSNVTATYAGSPTTGGAANTIVSQGALATQNSASWTTQVSSRPVELTDGRIATAITSAGGFSLSVAAAPSGSGLFLGSDYLGYYASGAWKTYMDSSGNFYLGGTSGALQWNGSALSITGTINVSGGNAAKTDFSNVTAAYAGSPTTGGAANSIVSQGALATQNAATWATQVTGSGKPEDNATLGANWSTNVSARPVELTDGRIAVALSSAGGILLAVTTAPSGSGLFIGSDYLGYYTGGSWRTYMDSSGNFYLGGTSGALQWNGSTLTISGNITVTGGNAAKTDFSNVTATYAGSPTTGGAANTIVSQGALATQNAATWSTQVTGSGKPEDDATLGADWATNLTGRPTELTDGRVATALNSSGTVVTKVVPASVASPGSSGLYLGSDRMGFYNGSAWKTYMDNSGNFYLAGASSNALAWDGTTLSIVGAITSTSGTIGGFTLASTTLSATNVLIDSGSPKLVIGNTSAERVQMDIVSTRPRFSGYNSSGNGTVVIQANDGVSSGGFISVNNSSGVSKITLAGASGLVSSVDVDVTTSYKVGGTTIVDASKNATLASITDEGSFSAAGLATFNNDDTSNHNSIVILGSGRLHFFSTTNSTYFTEDYGIRVLGSTDHPFQVKSCALCLDGCSGGGTNYTAGRLYFTDNVYLYASAGVLYLNDGNGDRPIT